MAEAFDPMPTPAKVLTEHGPLHRDDIARRLRDAGVADPDTVLDEILDEIECPARQLVDDRWVWLPTVLAGRVFTHRLDADEATHDLLTTTPDLDPITAVCDYEPAVADQAVLTPAPPHRSRAVNSRDADQDVRMAAPTRYRAAS